MAVALYLLSIRQHGLPAAPQQTASVPETAAVPEPPPPAAMAALAPDDAAASEGKPAAQPAEADGPLSAAEAATLVEAFRAANPAHVCPAYSNMVNSVARSRGESWTIASSSPSRCSTRSGASSSAR